MISAQAVTSIARSGSSKIDAHATVKACINGPCTGTQHCQTYADNRDKSVAMICPHVLCRVPKLDSDQGNGSHGCP